MVNTKFENATDLDDDTLDHKTTARDIAINLPYILVLLLFIYITFYII